MQWLNKVTASLYAALIEGERWKLYLRGLGKTLEISAGAVVLGILIGVIVAIIKVSAVQKKMGGHCGVLLRAGEWLCDVYLTVIRGTPVMLQLMIIYFSVCASMSDGTLAAIVGFGINSGAYVAEIVRSGIQSINRGQTEAGRSLGLSAGMTMRFIILPQAFRNILPALFNEFITLLKETSVASVIAVPDMVKNATNIKTKIYNIAPLYVTARSYLVLVVGLTVVQRKIEGRLRESDRR